MEKMVYSVQEVAEMLNLSKSYIYELIRREEIPSVKLGNKKLIPKEKFDNWLKAL